MTKKLFRKKMACRKGVWSRKSELCGAVAFAAEIVVRFYS
jgi:predicted membrane-bound mannosyltransferase